MSFNQSFATTPDMIDEEVVKLFQQISRAQLNGLNSANEQSSENTFEDKTNGSDGVVGKSHGSNNLGHMFQLTISAIFEKHIISLFENIDSIYLLDNLHPDAKQSRVYINIEKIIMLMDVALDFGITDLRERYMPRVFEIDESYSED